METEEKLIRLLIVDEGLHKAEKITSSLRAAGMHVRAEFAEDGEDMGEILENKTDGFIAKCSESIVTQGSDVTVIQLIAACIGEIQASDDIHQGRLSRA